MRKIVRKRIGLTIEHVRVLTDELANVRGGGDFVMTERNTHAVSQRTCAAATQ